MALVHQLLLEDMCKGWGEHGEKAHISMSNQLLFSFFHGLGKGAVHKHMLQFLDWFYKTPSE